MQMGNDRPSFAVRYGRILILLPPIFLFLMIQHSALVYPFYDHIELVHFFEKLYSHQLGWLDLFSPHNHTRPAVYRFVMLANGYLTDWDIRSEYVYLFGSIVLGFFFHFQTLKKLSLTRQSLVIFGIIFSVLYFSPVSHNNHWWSMMFQLTFTNAMIAFALTRAALDTNKKSNQIFAIVAFGLALFTLTNAIVALFSIVALHGLISLQKRKLTYAALLWIAVGGMLFAIYFLLPGHLETSSHSQFSFKNFISFFFVYLGAPIGLLLKFEYVNQFHIPTTAGITWLNGVLGFAFSLAAGFLLWKNRNSLSKSPEVRLLFVFTLFSVGSAALTAYGRSNFDSYGIYNANASRYTLFSIYLTFGLLYFFTHPEFRKKFLPSFFTRSIVATTLAVLFLLISFATYKKSIRVYRSSAAFNTLLNGVFYSTTNTNETFKRIYPDPARAEEFVLRLKKLRIGPYRHGYLEHSAQNK